MRLFRAKNKQGMFFEIIELTPREQHIWWNECMARVMNNTRWVLDNLDQLLEFKVNWEDYHRDGYYRDRYRKKKEDMELLEDFEVGLYK